MLFKALSLWLLAPVVTALVAKQPVDRTLAKRDYISNNWCGQVLYGSDFRDVSATWVVPTASPLSSQYSEQPLYNYQWVGIDGATANCQAILQAGTYARLQDNRLTYGFWYEFYPNDSWLMNDPLVRPGDTVFVQVKAYNTTSGYAYMENRSTGQHVTVPLDAPAGSSLCGRTAEWIQENASGSPRGLAPFSTFSFTGASAIDASGNQPTIEGSEKWFMTPRGTNNAVCYPSNVGRDSVQINYSGPTA
ncbi:Concanavalin A-like lectin/glucanase [Cordyceps fumosorosea ARSEF 2679]|uniref:Concanavalin A-like lectin/glucanase n=1 Tax=Cordyceps fumosorosea (strain ARSEF 2679) TaxID=1081104 RepID=A0A167LH28_CORFA|nr:Concanavalin A-like lectin/glucanase [Cordyceps fumosorosea ARSEF 2679]OAA53082.1 Concanavalin A-like lectin/glucanase [Cordyceps fumosorosea ARSEF 2679]